MRTWYEFNAKADSAETEVLLYDEIGGFGISAAAFIAELQQVPAAHRLVLRIHSPGGSVFDGNAIATALRGHPGGVTTHIDGLAASMATVIAIAGSPVQMAGNAMFMIHNVSAGARGDSADLRRMADLTDKVQETIVAQYVAKTGISRRRVLQMMEAETWMTASEAKEHGFIDAITGDLEMAAKFDLSGFRNAPSRPRGIDNAQAYMEPAITAEEKTLLQRLSAFFNPPAAEPVDPLVALQNQLDATALERNSLRDSLTAMTTARDEANTQLATATQERDTARTELQTERDGREATISNQVTQRLADAGAAPVARDPAAAATTEPKGEKSGLTGLAKARAALAEKMAKQAA